jgi:hypothetical protein
MRRLVRRRYVARHTPQQAFHADPGTLELRQMLVGQIVKAVRAGFVTEFLGHNIPLSAKLPTMVCPQPLCGN